VLLKRHLAIVQIFLLLKKFDTKSRYLEMLAFRFLCLLIQSEDGGDMGCCLVGEREEEHEEERNETRDVVVWIV